MNEDCSKEKLEAFSKKHYTYINQIFGDATVREIIEEEYPTTYQFDVENTGADFDFSFHHTVKDRDNGNVLCSVDDGYQNIYKNKNDTLCQSYSLLNYFDIDIPTDKKERQMEMVQMYRSMLNGTIDGFEDVDFKQIINNEILKVPGNKKLWHNFVTDKGSISMNKTTLFKNIENTLDEWEEYGYWFFIGKGECPKHKNYTSEMESQYQYSRDLSNERNEGYYMGYEDFNAKSISKKTKSHSKSPSKSSPKSVSQKNKSSPKSSPKSVSQKNIYSFKTPSKSPPKSPPKSSSSVKSKKRHNTPKSSSSVNSTARYKTPKSSSSVNSTARYKTPN